MRVLLIKRNKITHVGFRVRCDGEILECSACNKRWDINDKISIGDKNEVTCKRCKKILGKVDSDGCVQL